MEMWCCLNLGDSTSIKLPIIPMHTIELPQLILSLIAFHCIAILFSMLLIQNKIILSVIAILFAALECLIVYFGFYWDVWLENLSTTFWLYVTFLLSCTVIYTFIRFIYFLAQKYLIEKVDKFSSWISKFRVNIIIALIYIFIYGYNWSINTFWPSRNLELLSGTDVWTSYIIALIESIMYVIWVWFICYVLFQLYRFIRWPDIYTKRQVIEKIITGCNIIFTLYFIIKVVEYIIQALFE